MSHSALLLIFFVQVFVSSVGSESEKREAIKWLSDHSKPIRFALAQRMKHLKSVPELRCGLPTHRIQSLTLIPNQVVRAVITRIEAAFVLKIMSSFHGTSASHSFLWPRATFTSPLLQILQRPTRPTARRVLHAPTLTRRLAPVCPQYAGRLLTSP